MALFSTFMQAWKNRDALAAEQHSRELAAFLPAALEIQHAPPNPLAKWLGRCLILLFSLAIIWAILGEVNIVASAEGKIIPSSRVKQIQPLEKGMVKAILVKEGQQVSQGQALVELDSTLTSADENRLTQEKHSSQLQQQVHQQLIALLQLPEQKQATLQQQQVSLDFAQDVTADEQQLHQQLLWQYWQQYRSQVQTLHNTLTKTKQQQAASKAIISKLQQTLPIISKRTKKLQALHKQNFVSETEYLELEQQRIEQQQDLAAERHHLQQLKAAANEVTQQTHTLAAQTNTEHLTQLTELQRRIASLDEELAKATDLNAKQILYAPVSGQVQELAITTVGGVVTEAQQLMLIVPDEEQLEVEVYVENKDIGFVREGMVSEIKIHTFPFTKYGLIEGEIVSVSDDATVDEQRGLIYRMRLLMKRNTLWVDNREVKLMPGMAVTAEVKTGKRKVIEFFLAPLLQHGHDSLRER